MAMLGYWSVILEKFNGGSEAKVMEVLFQMIFRISIGGFFVGIQPLICVVRRWTWTFLNTGFSEVLAEDAMLSLAKGLWVCKRQSSKK